MCVSGSKQPIRLSANMSVNKLQCIFTGNSSTTLKTAGQNNATPYLTYHSKSQDVTVITNSELCLFGEMQ